MRAAWGFFAGLSAGAFASLIFTPKSGKETQELIVRKVRDGLDQAAFAATGVRALVKAMAGEKIQRVGETSDASKESYPYESPTRKAVLCIDDDGGMLSYLRVLLENFGYVVLTAFSARQGLQIAAACALAVVLVDYHMPEMNGQDLAIEIKRMKPQLPIVMVSGDDVIPEQASNLVDAVVSKNEGATRLLGLIARVCEKDAGQGEN